MHVHLAADAFFTSLQTHKVGGSLSKPCGPSTDSLRRSAPQSVSVIINWKGKGGIPSKEAGYKARKKEQKFVVFRTAGLPSPQHRKSWHLAVRSLPVQYIPTSTFLRTSYELGTLQTFAKHRLLILQLLYQITCFRTKCFWDISRKCTSIYRTKEK